MVARWCSRTEFGARFGADMAQAAIPKLQMLGTQEEAAVAGCSDPHCTRAYCSAGADLPLDGE